MGKEGSFFLTKPGSKLNANNFFSLRLLEPSFGHSVGKWPKFYKNPESGRSEHGKGATRGPKVGRVGPPAPIRITWEKFKGEYLARAASDRDETFCAWWPRRALQNDVLNSTIGRLLPGRSPWGAPRTRRGLGEIRPPIQRPPVASARANYTFSESSRRDLPNGASTSRIEEKLEAEREDVKRHFFEVFRPWGTRPREFFCFDDGDLWSSSAATIWHLICLDRWKNKETAARKHFFSPPHLINMGKTGRFFCTK